MRSKSMMTCALALYVVIVVQAMLAAPAKDVCALPQGLREEISKTYPGASIVSLKDLDDYDKKLFQKDHGARCPGLVKVDFYGDGKPTWALVLLQMEGAKRRATLVLARDLGKGWETSTLETTDGVPVVWRETPGKYVDVHGQKTLRATHPAIVFCGYGGWAILYSWTGKEVEKIWISD